MSDKLLYTALLLLSGCATQPNTDTPSTANLQRMWMITQLDTLPREQLIAKQAYLDLRHLPHATAAIGGSPLQFTLHAQQGRCHIHAITPVNSLTHPLDHRLNTLISHSRLYHIEGHHLTLTTAAGETVQFIAQDWD